MKREKFFIIYALAALLTTNVAKTFADEAIEIHEIRQQLTRARAVQQKVEKKNNGAATKELEQTNKELLHTEQELLRELQSASQTEKTSPLVPKETTQLTPPITKAKTASGEIFTNKAITQKEQPEQNSKKTQYLSTENARLEKELQKNRVKAQKLESELKRTRNRLLIAETEVERLTSIIHTGDRNVLTRHARRDTVKKAQTLQGKKSVPKNVKKNPELENGDLPIATVTVSKANLRIGPGLDNSPLMTVAKNTRLVVEKRSGDWYRVITPTGARAWVSSSVVTFQENNKGSSESTVRVKGYDSSLEETP